jgi:hypothetical protein
MLVDLSNVQKIPLLEPLALQEAELSPPLVVQLLAHNFGALVFVLSELEHVHLIRSVW